MLVFSASHYHRLVFSAALGKTAERMVVGRHRTGWRVVPHCSTNDGQAALQLFSRTETELLQAPSNPPAAQGRGEQSGSREQRGVSREEERQGAGSNLGREGASLVVRLTAGCWRRRVHQQLPHHLRSGQQAVSGLYNNNNNYNNYKQDLKKDLKICCNWSDTRLETENLKSSSLFDR